MMGFILILFAGLINTAAAPFADLVFLSQTPAITLLITTLLSIQMLGEIFTRYDCAAFILIVSGATSCVVFSNGQTV